MNVTFAADAGTAPARRDKKHFTANCGPVDRTEMRVDNAINLQAHAFAGDLGQCARFRILAETHHAVISTLPHAIDFPLQLSQAIIQQFTNRHCQPDQCQSRSRVRTWRRAPLLCVRRLTATTAAGRTSLLRSAWIRKTIRGPLLKIRNEADGNGGFVGRSLPEDEIAEHKQAVESAGDALRAWRDKLSGDAAQDAPAQPELLPPERA